MGATQVPTLPGGHDIGKVDPEGGSATTRRTLKCLGGTEPGDQAHKRAEQYSSNGPAPIDRGNRS